MFRLRFLGSVEVDEEEQVKNTKRGAATKKRLKKNMVEEAVIKIKVRISSCSSIRPTFCFFNCTIFLFFLL